jgi:hypothetical protein
MSDNGKDAILVSTTDTTVTRGRGPKEVRKEAAKKWPCS